MWCLWVCEQLQRASESAHFFMPTAFPLPSCATSTLGLYFVWLSLRLSNFKCPLSASKQNNCRTKEKFQSSWSTSCTLANPNFAWRLRHNRALSSFIERGREKAKVASRLLEHLAICFVTSVGRRPMRMQFIWLFASIRTKSCFFFVN